MFVPEWLGHWMLFSFAFIIVIIGLFVVYAFSVAFFDYLIPWLWYRLKVLKLKGMDEEQFYVYLDALEQEWLFIQEEKELKEHGSKD